MFKIIPKYIHLDNLVQSKHLFYAFQDNPFVNNQFNLLYLGYWNWNIKKLFLKLQSIKGLKIVAQKLLIFSTLCLVIEESKNLISHLLEIHQKLWIMCLKKFLSVEKRVQMIFELKKIILPLKCVFVKYENLMSCTNFINNSLLKILEKSHEHFFIFTTG